MRYRHETIPYDMSLIGGRQEHKAQTTSPKRDLIVVGHSLAKALGARRRAHTLRFCPVMRVVEILVRWR